MKTSTYVLDEYGDPQPCTDLMEWARWFEKGSNRVIKQEYVGDQFVSTVFLALDHAFGETGAPILYETMILGGAHDGYVKRCARRQDALRMHVKALSVARGERKA